MSRRRPAIGSGTVYVDIPLPFTRWALILDIGRHACLGYRLRHGRTLSDRMRAKRWPS